MACPLPRVVLLRPARAQRMHFDAISYHNPAFECGLSFVGEGGLVFGTDHPFFPPKLTPPATDIDAVPWPSCTKNQDVIADVGRRVPGLEEKVLWRNAAKLLRLTP